jgi:hypothetical protein
MKPSPLRTSLLGFVGSWDVARDANNQPVKSGDVNLVFRYTEEDGSAGVFRLPKSATINRTTNQLSYTYQKDTKTLSVAFQGTLMIDPDFQISYIFNRQVSSWEMKWLRLPRSASMPCWQSRIFQAIFRSL